MFDPEVPFFFLAFFPVILPIFVLFALAVSAGLIRFRLYRSAAAFVVLCIGVFVGVMLEVVPHAPPKPTEIIARFEATREGFETLRHMITNDMGARECITVGLDRVDYRIGKKRLDQYRTVLEDTGSEQVSYCKSGPGEILVYRSGLSVSGCTASFAWGNLVPDSDITPAYSIEVTPIVDDWYFELSCT